MAVAATAVEAEVLLAIAQRRPVDMRAILQRHKNALRASHAFCTNLRVALGAVWPPEGPAPHHTLLQTTVSKAVDMAVPFSVRVRLPVDTPGLTAMPPCLLQLSAAQPSIPIRMVL